MSLVAASYMAPVLTRATREKTNTSIPLRAHHTLSSSSCGLLWQLLVDLELAHLASRTLIGLVFDCSCRIATQRTAALVCPSPPPRATFKAARLAWVVPLAHRRQLQKSTGSIPFSRRCQFAAGGLGSWSGRPSEARPYRETSKENGSSCPLHHDAPPTGGESQFKSQGFTDTPPEPSKSPLAIANETACSTSSRLIPAPLCLRPQVD